MTLSPGARLGSYEVIDAIGAGGMGEVYRAKDTSLKRTVAIKVLPDSVAADPDRLTRFQREAEVLASLNHPNIAQVYGLEKSTTTTALVMELVEGPTLADRIAHGPIPLAEALPIAKQIAEALEAAHEQSIVHRDLKPANIKVRPDGTVKVLDFGLAKALEPKVSSADTADYATITSPAMTHGGVILGTAAYMSPEQARGKTVDKRADIWAFGCVLFEMLSGMRPFRGSDVTEILAHVLTKEPSWTALPSDTPIGVRRVLARCLMKDPKQRLHDIADVRIDLEAAEGDPGVRPAVSASSPRRLLSATTVAASIVSAAIGGLLVYSFAGRSKSTSLTSAGPIRATIDLPADAPLALGTAIPRIGFNSPTLALSPDGASLVYVANAASGSLLHLRDLRSGAMRPLPTTEGAIHPFFSPDSRWIGFLTDDHVKKIARDGGTAATLAPAREPVLAWWPTLNTIYFTNDEGRRLFKVGANGGGAEHISTTAEAKVWAFLDVLPDERTALAESRNGISGDYHDIVQVDLQTGSTKALVKAGYAARYSPAGYLLFIRGGNLMAMKYDITKATVSGEPLLLAAGVAAESLWGISHVASCASGTVAYVPGNDLSIGHLAWVARDGAVQYLSDLAPRVYGVVSLAPDDNLIAVHVGDVGDYILLWDPRRREGRRVPNSAPEGWPVWDATGRRLASSKPSLTLQSVGIIVHDVSADGGVGSGVAIEDKGRQAQAWSPLDDVLAVLSFPSHTEFLGLHVPVQAAGFDGWFPSFAPDGRWLAYGSTSSGTDEIVIRSYPDGKVVRQVSTAGGIEPRWKRSGDLYFRNGHRWYATHVVTTPELHWDPPHQVFDTEFIDTPGLSYDITADGKRLLVVKRAQPITTNRINIIVNWPDVLQAGTSPR